MESHRDYPILLEIFEGPLDLLLYLIKKDEVDVYDIPIVSITDQYMRYLDTMKMLDLGIAGEFLVMAATLMMIKSRMLLPAEERPEEDAEEEDPRWDLVRQLVEYKKFKDAALFLEDLEGAQTNVLPPEGDGVELGADRGLALRDVSIFDLIDTFQDILNRAPKENLKEIFTERFTVADKIEDLMGLLAAPAARLSLTGLFRGMRSRQEMVCTFLAVLELIRLRHIRAVQEGGAFGEITVLPGETDPIEAPVLEETEIP